MKFCIVFKASNWKLKSFDCESLFDAESIYKKYLDDNIVLVNAKNVIMKNMENGETFIIAKFFRNKRQAIIGYEFEWRKNGD